MGFWGKLGGAFKKIGKVALKAAPIAASFIPGVGIPAAMGIGALSKGLSNKFSGGSFLGGALSGAAEGGVGGLAKSAIFGGGKGLGASPGFWDKFKRGAMGGMLGRPIGRGYGMPQYPYSTPPFNGGYNSGYNQQAGPIRRSYTQQQLSPFAQSVANNSRRFTMSGY